LKKAGISMEALIYISTAAALPRPSTINDILRTARRVNPGLGLTGMLLWADTRFAQLLEGPPDALDLLYGRLLKDRRHHDLTLLSRWEIPQRLFPDWSMASRRLDPYQAWELLERLGDSSSDDAAAWILYLMNEIKGAGLRKRRGQ
jgi:hypothetical protein